MMDLIQLHNFVSCNSAYFNHGKVLGGSVHTRDIGIISASNWSQLTGVLPAATDARQIRVTTKTGHLQGNRFCFYPGAASRHQLIAATNIHTVSSNQLQSGHLLLPHGASWIHMGDMSSASLALTLNKVGCFLEVTCFMRLNVGH